MTPSTLTLKQHQAIVDRLTAHPTLARGLGTEDQACSLAAINLALTGKLTDQIPACMSEVVGRWIITIQDAMPAEIRNSQEWRELLPAAAGTGRELEQERAATLMDHMWTVTLPLLQPIADTCGFGSQWLAMCQERTEEAAHAAYLAAYLAYHAYHAYHAANAAYHATCAADAAHAAAHQTARSAARAAGGADAAARAAAWQTIDPVGLLRQLIEVTA